MIIISELTAPITFTASTNKKEPQSSVVTLRLNPGVNDLQGEDEEQMAWVKDIAEFKEYIEAEKLIIVVNAAKGEEKEGKAIDSLPNNLAELDLKMAISLVKATVVTDVLQGWLRNEKRQPVRKSIEDQIKLMREYETRAAEVVASR